MAIIRTVKLPYLAVGRNLLLRSRRLLRDPIRGKRTIEIWTGTAAAVYGKAAQYDYVGSPVIYDIDDSDAPLFKITLSLPDNGPDTERPVQWELSGNGLQKDVLEHPLSRQIYQQNKADILAIQKWLRSDRTGTQPGDPGGDTLSNPLSPKLRDLMTMGTLHYQLGQYVLKQTMIGSDQSFPGVSYIGAESFVFKTADIASGGALDFGLPATINDRVKAIDAYARQDQPAQPNYEFGWLMQASTISTLPGGKYQLTQQWWFEYWSTYLYTVATPATFA